MCVRPEIRYIDGRGLCPELRTFSALSSVFNDTCWVGVGASCVHASKGRRPRTASEITAVIHYMCRHMFAPASWQGPYRAPSQAGVHM